MSWRELRVIVEHLGTTSALWRAKHPKSWMWDINTELLSAILYTNQGGNWQRAGGKGEKPTFLKRPNEVVLPTDISEWDTDAKKAALDDEIARRRARRDARAKRTGKTRGQKLIDKTPAKAS